MSPRTPTAKILLIHGHDPQLQGLIQRAKTLASLDQALRARLDKPIADRLTLANIRQSTAIILVDSPVWLTRLRYLSPIILQEIQNLGQGQVTSVEMKVAPREHAPPAPPAQPAHRPSAETLKQLRGMAEGLHDDRLRDALNRIIDDSDS